MLGSCAKRVQHLPWRTQTRVWRLVWFDAPRRSKDMLVLRTMLVQSTQFDGAFTLLTQYA